MSEQATWPQGTSATAELIRSTDWAGTPLRATETWSASLCAVVDMLLGCSFPMIALWGPELVQIYNDGYAAIMADKHPAGMGQPTRECWPEVWSFNQPIYQKVSDGETLTFEDRLFRINRHGYPEDAYFTLCYSPLRDEGGATAGVLVTLWETTKHVRESQESQLKSRRSDALVAATSYSTYIMSPDWSEMRYLEGSGFLADTASVNREWLRDYIHPADQENVLQAIRRAVETETMFELEHRVFRSDGALGWTLSRAVPIRNDAGEITEWFGAASDVTARKVAEIALVEGESIGRIALAGGRMGTWRWSLSERLVWGDEQFLELWGFSPSADPLPLALFTNRMSPEGSIEMEAVVTRAIKEGEEFDGSLEIMSGPTSGHWVRWRGRTAENDTSVLYGVTFDITEAKRAEEALRGSEERQAFLLALSDALNSLTDPIELQQTAMRMLAEHLKLSRAFLFYVEQDAGDWLHVIDSEYRRDDAAPSMIGHHSLQKFGDQHFKKLSRGIPLEVPDVRTLQGVTQAQLAAYQAVHVTAFVNVPLRREGKYSAGVTGHDVVSRVWKPFETEMMRDVGDRTWAAVERARAELALRVSLAEKDVLLSEVHHRVKNNLQVITSLLNLQSREAKDRDVRALFSETRNRVQSISSIHELLYRSNSFAEVDLFAYAQQLVPSLVRFYGAQARVQVEVEGEGATLELQRAVPLGLLLNELVSNALKHGLPDPETGLLRIGFLKEGKTMVLGVQDTGLGLSKGLRTEQGESLGLKLVHVLAEQLNGTVDIRSDGGTSVRVHVPIRTGKPLDPLDFINGFGRVSSGEAS